MARTCWRVADRPRSAAIPAIPHISEGTPATVPSSPHTVSVNTVAGRHAFRLRPTEIFIEHLGMSLDTSRNQRNPDCQLLVDLEGSARPFQPWRGHERCRSQVPSGDTLVHPASKYTVLLDPQFCSQPLMSIHLIPRTPDEEQDDFWTLLLHITERLQQYVESLVGFECPGIGNNHPVAQHRAFDWVFLRALRIPTTQPCALIRQSARRSYSTVNTVLWTTASWTAISCAEAR